MQKGEAMDIMKSPSSRGRRFSKAVRSTGVKKDITAATMLVKRDNHAYKGNTKRKMISNNYYERTIN